MKLLLVEDDPDLLDVTAYALRREGFVVLLASDGHQGLNRWRTERPDVVILDIGLPGIDGLQICRTIRQAGPTPIILLTAYSDESQVVAGFNAGADDYVTKPFSPRQLAWRVRAVARRSSASALEPASPARLTIGDLSLEVDSHEVRRGSHAVRLTPIEFELFYVLACNIGRVVSIGRLLNQGWGHDADDPSLLKTHFSHLRKKLAPLVGVEIEIESIPRVGYRLLRHSAA